MGRSFLYSRTEYEVGKVTTMDFGKAFEILNETADTLEDLSRRLRALADSETINSASFDHFSIVDQRRHELEGGVIADGKDSAISQSAQYAERLAIANRIRSFWADVTLSHKMQVGEEIVDLKTSEGKWELLILAVLIGARVRERVVEQTFGILKREGLLRREPLINGDVRTKERLIQLFRTHYKALGNRRAKVEALFWNARYLEKTWGGDLDQIYQKSGKDKSQLIQQLREFQQIGRVAYWICRTLHAHGIWDGVAVDSTWYFDRYPNLPLSRLGFLDHGNRRTKPNEIKGVLRQWFEGDVVSLYMHGLVLCSQDNPNACLAECPVSSWCKYPKEEK